LTCVLFCIGEVVIETVLCINCCIDDSTISLNFVEITRCTFPVFCECVYDLEYGNKSGVSVWLLVCCIVRRLLRKYKNLLSLVPSSKRTKNKNTKHVSTSNAQKLQIPKSTTSE
jgi:hypothetical protein